VVNVIDMLERGELALAKHHDEYGYVADGETDEPEAELLRLAKLGATAEKAMGDCRTPKELQLNCSFCDRCAIYDVCKLRKE
jgi:hypothetical protein